MSGRSVRRFLAVFPLLFASADLKLAAQKWSSNGDYILQFDPFRNIPRQETTWIVPSCPNPARDKLQILNADGKAIQ